MLSLWNQIGRAFECERLMGRMIGKEDIVLEMMESLDIESKKDMVGNRMENV